jgi:hypothetical protein
MVKLLLALSSQPDGGGEDGAMPSSTAWAETVAATKTGTAKLVKRIVSSYSGSRLVKQRYVLE